MGGSPKVNVLLCSTVRVISEAICELESEGKLTKKVLAVFGPPGNDGSKTAYQHVDHAALIEAGLRGAFEGVDPRYLTIDLLDETAWAEKYVYPMMDRLDPLKMHTHAQRKYLYQHLMCFWAEVIDRRKFDVAIFGSAPHEVSDFVLYALCKNRNIKTLIFNYTRLPGTCFVSSSYSPRDILQREASVGIAPTGAIAEYVARIRQSYAKAIPIDTKEVLDNFGRAEIPGRLKRSINIPALALRRALLGAKLLRSLGLEKIKAVAQWKLNKAEWRALVEDYSARSRHFAQPKRYAYFLLNFQPENTTSPLGQRFVDQYLAVSTLASSLPEDCAIVVKEHPAQLLEFGHYNHLGRDANYYRRLSAIRGVCFAPPTSDHFQLLDDSLFVASVNGTVGWEAVVRKKPAIVFGEAWYQDAPGVFKVDTVQQCAEAIRMILGGVTSSDETIDEFLRRFLSKCELLCLTEEDARVSGVPFDFRANVDAAKGAILRHLDE